MIEILIQIAFGFAVVYFLFPRRKGHTESNPVYHKKFWREVREDEDKPDYPGPMPM